MGDNNYYMLVFLLSIVFFSVFSSVMMNHGYDRRDKEVQESQYHETPVSKYSMLIENRNTVSPH